MTIAGALFCASLITFIQKCHGCGLGHTIQSITVSSNGDYQVNCSFRAHPICPEQCYWTEKTCEDYGKERHWNHQKQLMANITYSYPRQRQSKNNATTTVISTSTPASVSKRVKRQCCNSTTLTATKCQSTEWQPSSSNSYKFDVGAWAKKNLHCQKDDAVVRDVKPKKQNELIFDICCLDYVSEDKRVVCASPDRGGKGGLGVVGIGAAIALPLALGIGIPLLIEEEEIIHCHDKYNIVPGEFPDCRPPRTDYYDVPTVDECCFICEKSPGVACGYISFGTLKDCLICRNGYSSADPLHFGTAFYPK